MWKKKLAITPVPKRTMNRIPARLVTKTSQRSCCRSSPLARLKRPRTPKIVAIARITATMPPIPVIAGAIPDRSEIASGFMYSTPKSTKLFNGPGVTT